MVLFIVDDGGAQFRVPDQQAALIFFGLDFELKARSPIDLGGLGDLLAQRGNSFFDVADFLLDVFVVQCTVLCFGVAPRVRGFGRTCSGL